MLTFADDKTLIAMKKSFIIVTLMCCIMSASAQQHRNGNNLTVKLDSITEGMFKSHLEYDARLNCTRWTEYMDGSDGWFVLAFYEYTYDDQDRMTSKTSHNNGVTKYEYFYNEQSLVSEVIYSYYNGTNWHFTDKYNYEYDEEGNRTLYIQYDYEDGNWTEKEKKVWEYEGGLLQSMLHYLGNFAFEKLVYHYNEQGLCNEMIQCAYNADPGQIQEWNEYYKELYEYDEAGKLLSRVKLNANSNEWYYREKTELAYDENNNCTDISIYSGYDQETGQWLYLNNAIDFAYDPTINIDNIAGLSMFWKEWFRDLDLDIPLFNELQQITKNDLGYNPYQYDFYYSNYNGLNKPSDPVLSVWPNPATETIRIEGIEPAEVQVYNAFGQLLKTVHYANEICVADLAEGFYLLRITDVEGKKHMARVVVKG